MAALMLVVRSEATGPPLLWAHCDQLDFYQSAASAGEKIRLHCSGGWACSVSPSFRRVGNIRPAPPARPP